MSIQVGQTLLHYRIVEKLGEGGMGVVWKASDDHLKREVAVKVLPDDVARDARRLARFQREARLLAALNHPNIVTLHALEQDGDRHFLVMECVSGKSLDQEIPRGGVSRGRFFELALPLVEAVAAAHGRKITHRDLKPSNVMIGDDGRVRVLDFGLAKFVADADAEATRSLGATQAGTVLGTCAYMSPEQAQGKDVDIRSDVFSLGVLLFEMAIGRRPFEGASAAEIISSVLRDPVPSISAIRDDLLLLDRSIARCLEKDRTERYASAGELLEALLQARDDSAGNDRSSQSIAVLPFANLSGNPDEEFFSDGISEEIINALSTIDGLRVAARTSAFAFKGLAIDVPEIARKLNVRNVLEGSVRKAGNRVRVTAQLVSADDGCHIWSERFDRELDDIFAVQDEIATGIVRRVQGEVSGASGRSGPLVKRPTQNIEAYEAYLKGLHKFDLGIHLGEARDCFQRAVELDPDFASAWASLADAYSTLSFTTRMRPHDAMPRAREAAERALALDDKLSEAHSALAYIHLIYGWDWEAARKGFERTLKLNANDSRTMHHFGHLYHGFVSRRLEEGLALCARSMDVDPIGGYSVHGYYANLLIMGRYDQAIDGLTRELARAPQEAHFRRILGLCYLEKGMLDEARETIELALHYSGRHPWAVFELGMYHARAGDRDAALAVQGELEARSRTGYVQGSVMSVIPAWLGDMDEAFSHLERAYEERDGVLIAITTWPAFRPLWGDPRHGEMLRRLKLGDPV